MKILFDSNGPFESDSSNDFNGRKRSETMVQRYDKRSIVRNAIDPRQSVTVTRDALRYRIPDAIPVWLRTNTRVKINADTSLTGQSSIVEYREYPRCDYILYSYRPMAYYFR